MAGQGFQKKFPPRPVSKTIKNKIFAIPKCEWERREKERNNTNVKCTAQLSSVQVRIN